MSRTTKPKPAYQEFVFRVREPSLSYSFGVQHDRRYRDIEPFREHETLHFIADCLYPDRLVGRECAALIIPEPLLSTAQSLAPDDPRREWIGYIRIRKNEFSAAISVPAYRVMPLGQAMATGLVRSMLANGPVEAPSMVRITGVSFYGKELDPEAYIG